MSTRRTADKPDLSALPVADKASEEPAAEGAAYAPEDIELMEQQLTETVLPPEIEEWFSRLCGCLDISMPFDSRTYFDEADYPYGDDD